MKLGGTDAGRVRGPLADARGSETVNAFGDTYGGATVRACGKAPVLTRAAEGPLMAGPGGPAQTGGSALLAGLVLLLACSCAFAVDPALDVSQYAHTSWKYRDRKSVV